MSKSTIILAAGGTGGHLFPAVSLAEHLQSLGCKTILVTDERGVKFYQGQGFDQVLIRHVSRYSKLLKQLSYPLSFTYQFLRCLRDVIKIQPSTVIGFGGYPSLPIALAAVLMRIPLIIHEQNSNLGKANRLLAKFAKKICLSFEPSIPIPNSIVVGNLVRSNILQLGEISYKPPKNNENYLILVIGGSQGSNVVTKNVALAIQELPAKLQEKLTITQQCRDELLEEIQSIYRHTSAQVMIRSFFPDIENYLSKAHLVICRSGASTVAELAFCGKPAILIPFAAAIESDQFYNAQEVIRANAGWMITENQLTPKQLADMIEAVLNNPQELMEKSNAIRSLWKPNVRDHLTKIIAETSKILLPI